MCGFLGYIVEKNSHKSGLDQKFDFYQKKMNHRGPDFQTKIKLEENDTIACFGFNRLSIQDLNTNANRIFRNDDYLLLFNGEIYNKLNLIQKYLINQKFDTQSDTEVLFKLLTKFGTKIIKEIEGIFSIIFYDINSSNLYMIRDYTGTKPLYYFNDEKNLYFASEAWFLYSLSKKKLNFECLNFYFRYGFSPNSKTLINNVLKVKPNSILKFNIKKNQILDYKIIDFSKENNFLKENNSSLRKDLSKSIEKNLIGDRKIGVFLSGGIDSTIISLTTRKINEKIEAYTSIYEDNEIEKDIDYGYTKRICDQFNIKLNLATITKKEIFNGDLLNRISSFFDEPIANLNIISSYKQSKLANQNDLSVIITGDGADEIFGGYRKYQTLEISRKLKYLSFLNKKIKNYTIKNDKIPYLFFKKNDNENYKYIFKNDFFNSIIQIKNHLFENYNEDNLTKLNKFDFYNWLPDEHNLKLDRCTMANSVEGRVPFQDLTILKYFNPEKIKNKINLNQNKLELREAFSDLPNYILNRKKRGWFLDDKKILKHFLQKNAYDLFKTNSGEEKIFNEENLLNSINQDNKLLNKFSLTTIVMFKLWYRQVMDC